MNKIYITLILMVTFTWATAQSVTKMDASGQNKIPVSIEKQNAFKSSIKGLHADSKGTARWYNYATTMDQALGGISALSMTYLFPDTTIIAKYGTTNGGPWMHNAGVVLDPKSAWFQSSTEYNITGSDNYTLDSVGFLCSYTRHLASTVVDTLIVEFVPGSSNDLPVYYFTGMAGNYFSDTVRFAALTHTNGMLDAASKTVVKYLLTEADTVSISGGWNYILVGAPSPIAVNAGENVAVAYQFKPGYSYSLTDTLNNMNYFTMVSYEEQGDNTYPTYAPGDYNSSQITEDDSRFNPNSGWYGFYIPEWAYTQGYGFENHVVDFMLSVNIGINAAEENIISVSQNFPNPFNGTTDIAYNLTKTANVNVAVYNVAGAQIMNVAEGLKTAGNHKVQLDASNLPAGIYYYTFTADNYSVTKKMIVY
jgi:hypothetical protein